MGARPVRLPIRVGARKLGAPRAAKLRVGHATIRHGGAMKLNRKVPGLLSAVLAGGVGVAGLVHAASLTVGSAVVEEGATYSAPKSVSGALARTDPALLGRTDSTPVNVLIKYDFDATASYMGNIAGLAATSPSVTGKKLKDNEGPVSAYEKHASDVTNKINGSVKAAVPSAAIGK